MRGGGQLSKQVTETLKFTEKRKGFTLAETLITLTILGVVAAITVPMLINKQMEAANRTRVKKAMAAYEKALNQMIIENDLKSGDAIKAFGEVVIDGLGCANTRPYFKAIESVSGNNCRFKTADRVWRDITDIQHPIIALNDDYKNATLLGEGADTLESLAKSGDNKEVFGMVGTIDNGVVRINDKGATTDTDDAALLNKTYAFINNEKASAGGGAGGTTVPKTPQQIASAFADGDYNTECTTTKMGCYELVAHAPAEVLEDMECYSYSSCPHMYTKKFYDENGDVMGELEIDGNSNLILTGANGENVRYSYGSMGENEHCQYKNTAGYNACVSLGFCVDDGIYDNSYHDFDDFGDGYTGSCIRTISDT